MTDIIEKNRHAVEQIRRTPMPISDVIPLLTESNDTIEKLRGEVAAMEAELATERAESAWAWERLAAQDKKRDEWKMKYEHLKKRMPSYSMVDPNEGV
jgi:chromosome segregation ATPase